MKKTKGYSADFKHEAVSRMAQATNIVGLAKELGIRRKLLYEWRDQFRTLGRAGLERGPGRPPGTKSQTVSPPAPSGAELRIAELERLLGRKHHRLRGYRLLTETLRREGQVVNHKRVLRLMREDNLLSLRRKKHVFTTDSTHTLPIYPNLARHATLTALNQLWVADITFIRLRSEFIYLAVVLDAYSRRVIGWDLGRTLQAGLATRALQMALRGRSWKAEGLIHHSDRGIQYASSEYTELLEQGEIQISMSRRGNPYDNARAERFMRTLKEEEVYGSDYRNLEDARSRIGEFLEQTYNRQRLHSALRYLHRKSSSRPT